jgi:signal transduction histidine kinase
VIENLVTNAIRYTATGTPIWVSLDNDDQGLIVRVEDAGPGVSPALRDTIFEPFRQGTEQVEHSPGVGIGLSLVARFAELHGGRAWVEERDGGGSSFNVFFANVTPDGYRARTTEQSTDSTTGDTNGLAPVAGRLAGTALEPRPA